MVRRPPAVAGRFYPADPQSLRREVESYVDRQSRREPARAVLVPHAGYVYSGGCAGKTFSAVTLPARFLILCPNHTGLGSILSTDDAEAWDTPLGAAPLDRELVACLRKHCEEVVPDDKAHRREHALEVQLPFLQVLAPSGFRFAPVCVGTGDRATLERFGHAMAAALRELEPQPLIVISSDMTHYESAGAARRKDQKAIARLEALDAGGLHDVVRRESITMCGFAPAVAALTALRDLGGSSGRLVQYTHSGMVTGDDREVVAYAGMVFA